ncbi:mandelate racemase/muconate lactonizing enzyme family protein [Clostridium sp. WLY-B-L2]|uniref:Mandelate racemase/muconate lactonizing enzyme family protein n=1 Tax=Clostridium aromativorans TaxID=2836848 RepID=A0ABS8N9W0_9CLOT|nr:MULTISPECIES: mandelate racemase/muconate lactonizing enzyme family protein [Clostridium]KAA8666589.1 mandelate racemase/muconate lactonizing enzyme family protein [Clostridium sp. HV4-5-A1G]MCC9295503.1 mandelate racemase/muconate lactonizing enzyme family protein [Clostridium aromativorans]CAB1245207.1 L-alanine-DL-glutamate epimerase [Clostridiaceae bacterium BL-3]
MKITSVDILQLKSEDNSWRPIKETGWRPIIVRINTDEGIYGYGEVALAYGNAADGGFAQTKEFAKLIIGEDPMKIEAIWDKLYKDTFWGQGGGGIVFAAISGIDIALWDIKGKALGVPIYQLLGGKIRNNLRAYASQIQFGWDKESYLFIKPEEYAESAKKAVSEGYTAIKVDPFQVSQDGSFSYRNFGLITYDKLKLYRDRLVAIRESVGPGIDIILENHAGTDVNSAIQFARTIEDLNIYFDEEVCSPLNPSLTKKVKNKVNIPLAGGERIYSRWGYRPFFENGSLDVIQPDLGNCGGITEGKKICDMAYTYDVLVQCHVCGSPIATAAALQLEAVIPNFVIHEHNTVSLKDYNIDFCKYDYQPVNGYYEIPNKPGLGQELTEKAIENAFKITIK